MTDPLIVPCKMRGCKARIIKATTHSGATMPLNPRPDPDGNTVLIPTPLGMLARVATKAQLPGLREAGVRLYMPHFKTCANPPPKKDRHQRAAGGHSAWRRGAQ
ncbi:MAG: hypothetical protein ACRDTG_28440 [Pseudonocardiaceae bacterium]